MEMPYADAVKVFQKYGVNADGMNPSELKTIRNDLIKTHHQDFTGNKVASQEINAAYDSLTDRSSISSYHKGGDEPPGRPAWQTDSRSNFNRINRNDYTDLNFIMKTMWEKSDWSREKWMAWAFDGYFFRGSFTVFGNPQIFEDIADAMVAWEANRCRAVFISGPNNNRALYLVWADGKHLSPIEMEHDSFNLNPGNDQQFVRRLPEMLDRLRDTGRI
jgi:hypothetical protein